MLDFRYRSIVLVAGLFLAASWPAQADLCVTQGAKNDESSTKGHNDKGSTPSMVQRDVLEFAMSVDEERREAPEVAAPAARLSNVEAPEMTIADAQLSKVEATPAPWEEGHPQPQLFSKSRAEAGNSSGDDSSMEALNRKYTATAAAGIQLLRSMKRRLATGFRDILRRHGVLKQVERYTARASFALFLFLPLFMVSFIVLLIVMNAWWNDTNANKERNMWWDLKSRPPRGSFRGASSMPIPQHATQISQPPSLITLPGRPSELTPGRMPRKSVTSMVQQTDWLS